MRAKGHLVAFDVVSVVRLAIYESNLWPPSSFKGLALSLRCGKVRTIWQAFVVVVVVVVVLLLACCLCLSSCRVAELCMSF